MATAIVLGGLFMFFVMCLGIVFLLDRRAAREQITGMEQRRAAWRSAQDEQRAKWPQRIQH